MRRALKALFVIAVAFVGAIIVPGSATAAPSRNGICEPGEFCYYYNSNHLGSLSDFTRELNNYGTNPSTCYHFIGPGNGRNQCIKNNAASVWNRTSSIALVYYNSDHAGVSQAFLPNAKINLNYNLKNQNASHKFMAMPPPPPRPVEAAPVFKSWQDGFGGINAHVSLSFRASDTYKGKHIRQAYVHLSNSCYPKSDPGRRYTPGATSIYDTQTYRVEFSMKDSLLPNCDMIANWGVETYF